jgi:2-haloacid dehalogenase
MSGLVVDAVVFDLGGVLIDWDPRYLYRQLFTDPAEMEDFLARICTADWHRAHDLGEDITESCRLLARQHPGYQEMIMAWAERGEEMVAGQIDENVEVLAELMGAGVRCLALSNMEPGPFAVRQARFPFLGWFDGCVISGLEGVAKPDRRIFEILLQRHRLAPGPTVFVDDSARNVSAARELGISALHYRSPQQLRRDFARLGLLSAGESAPAAGQR